MGAVWFRGVYEDNIVVVETHTEEARGDCSRIGLSRVDSKPDLSSFSYRTGYLAPGLTVWYEKPDPAAVARRQREQQEQEQERQRHQAQQAEQAEQERQQREARERREREERERREREERERREAEQRREAEAELERQRAEQLEQHRQQDAQDRRVLDAAERRLAAAQASVAAEVAQREQRVAQVLAARAQVLSETLAHEDSADLAAKQDAVASARAARIALMERQAAEFRAQQQQQQQQSDEVLDNTVQQELADALSMQQARLEALETAVASHVDAETQQRAADEQVAEMERRERAQMRTQVLL